MWPVKLEPSSCNNEKNVNQEYCIMYNNDSSDVKVTCTTNIPQYLTTHETLLVNF